jgi:hypothetical protein
MKNTKNLAFLLISSILLAGCIKVELKDEREIPKFYEIVLVTFTPEGQLAGQATATPPAPPTTQAPTATATAMPSDTPTSLPTATPVSPTPTASAMVSMNAWCRQGPGVVYPGISLLTSGEMVTLLGRNLEATWWLVQPGGGEGACWASAGVISLIGEYPGLAIVTAPPTPVQANPVQPAAATQGPRQKPPRPAQGTPPSPTDTPNPYPYPAP